MINNMKLYEFKHACIAFCFTLTYLGFFVFGIIWLNNGFRIEDMILESEIRMLKRFEEDNKIRDVEISRHEEMLQSLLSPNKH